MKISEGIRIGSKGKTQIKDSWWDNKNGVCAIGALMKIAGEALYEFFPDLQRLLPNNNFLINEIKDRNDKGHTFNQIIEWLKSIGY